MDREVDSLFYKAASELQGVFRLTDLIKKFNSVGGRGIPYEKYGFDYMRNLPFLIANNGNYELVESYREEGSHGLPEEDQLVLQAARKMAPIFKLPDLIRGYNALHRYRTISKNFKKHGYKSLNHYLQDRPFLKEVSLYSLDQSYVPEESEEEEVRIVERESSVISSSTQSHVSESSLSKESMRILRLARTFPAKFKLLSELCIYYRLMYKTPLPYEKYGYLDELAYLRSQPFLKTNGDKFSVKDLYLVSSEEDTEDDREEINGVHMPPKNDINNGHIDESEVTATESFSTLKMDEDPDEELENDRIDEHAEDLLVLEAARTLPATFHLQILLDRYRFLHENREIPYDRLGFTCEREYIDQLPFLKTNGFEHYKLDTEYLEAFGETEWTTQEEQAPLPPPTIHSEQTEKNTNKDGEVSQTTEQSNNFNNTSEDDKENSYKQITEANLVLEAAREPPTIFTLWTLIDRYKSMHKRMLPFAELGFKSLQEYINQLPFIKRRDYDEYELDMSYMLSVYGEQEGWWSQTQSPSRFALNYGQNQNMEGDDSHGDNRENGNIQTPKVTLKEGESLKIHAIVSRFAFDFTDTDILDRYRILYNTELSCEKTGYPTASQFLSSLPFLEKLPGGRGFRRLDREKSVELKSFEKTEESDAGNVKTAIENQKEADSSKDSDITFNDEKSEGDKTVSDENETKGASDDYDTALDEQEEEDEEAMKEKDEPKDPKEKLKKSQIYGKYISTMMEQAEKKGVDVDELAQEILVLLRKKL